MLKVKEIAASEGNQDYRKDYRVILRLDENNQNSNQDFAKMSKNIPTTDANIQVNSSQKQLNEIVFSITHLQPAQRPSILLVK